MDLDNEYQSAQDFSELPEEIWVRIMRHLSYSDRAKLARTCRLLNQAFEHPSLWNSQELRFMGESLNFSRKKQNIFCIPFYIDLTKRFGKYFQKLTIKIDSHLRNISEDQKEILEEVVNQCRLETLTIDAGTITSAFQEVYGYPPNYSVVKTLASFVQKAFRMKHLHIKSWPMYRKIDTEECNVLKVLVLNEKLRNTLETLTLFWIGEKEWSEREPILFSDQPTIIVDLVDSFKYLTTLGLRTPMITNELLKLLASPERAKLQLLKVVVHYLDPSRKPQFRVPNIESSTWQALVNRNPQFRVECTILLDTPNLELSNMFTPEVPMSALSFMKYSQIDPFTLIKLHSQYKVTMSKFHSFCDSYNNDQELLEIVQKCKNLTDFIYHGKIHRDTVVAIAKARGDAWKRFEVREDKIKVPSKFDDSVLAPGPNGKLVLVGLMKFHMSEEERDNIIQMMATEVSSTLGTPWKPLK